MTTARIIRPRVAGTMLLALCAVLLPVGPAPDAATAAVQPTASSDSAPGRPRLVVETAESGFGVGVAFSPDGRRVLTGSKDGTATLWDAEKGERLFTFPGQLELESVALSPDGRRVLTQYMDGSASLWDTDTGQQIRTLANRTGSASTTTFSPDGRLVLTLGTDAKTAELLDADTGQQIQSFVGHLHDIVYAAISPDKGRVLTGSADMTAKLWDVETGRELRTFLGHTSMVTTVAFSPDGRWVLTGSADKTVKLWDVETGYELRTFLGHTDEVASVAFSPDGRGLLVGSLDGTSTLWDLATGRQLWRSSGHSGPVLGVGFSLGKLLVTSSANEVKFWDAATGRLRATLFSFRDGTWAVVDPDGRFDASNVDDIEGVHWVVGDTTIGLWQLKERYYEPALLAKVLGFNKEPLRPVESFAAPRLFPQIDVSPPPPGDTSLTIHLKNCGGGIGKVRVLVNGKEIAADARGPKPNPDARSAALTVDLAGAGIRAGQENTIEIVAWNAEGYLSSRGLATWHAPGAKQVEPPEVFAIVCGTSRYALPSMNLSFAGKDAADMAAAIQVSAKRLFGAEKVHLTLLTDYPGAQAAGVPSRDNLRKAFEAAQKAKPDDVLVVYLSGHGGTAPDGEYWYLTREARTTDLSDPQVRAISGVSSAELTEWIKAMPATKQVMILDTCAAGAAAAKLTEVRALTSDQVLALSRLKDRTGFHVLMGSAADAVSYEASQYGQGLLTYALLQGMRGAALRDDEYVDVSRLFGYAEDQVPQLARNIGGIQRPQIAAPKGSSFDIGELTAEDKPHIPLAMVRPLILRPLLIDPEENDDTLNLSVELRKALKANSYLTARGGAEEPRAGFVDADELPGAVRPAGTYTVTGTQVHVRVALKRDGQRIGMVEVEGTKDDLAGLASRIQEAIDVALRAR